MCEVSTVGKISDYQPDGPGFNPGPGRGLNFGDLLSPHCPRTGMLSLWSSLSMFYISGT